MSNHDGIVARDFTAQALSLPTVKIGSVDKSILHLIQGIAGNKMPPAINALIDGLLTGNIAEAALVTIEIAARAALLQKIARQELPIVKVGPLNKLILSTLLALFGSKLNPVVEHLARGLVNDTFTPAAAHEIVMALDSLKK